MTEHRDLVEQRREELGEEAIEKAMDSSVSQIILHVDKRDPSFKSYMRTEYHSAGRKLNSLIREKRKKISWTDPVIRKWSLLKLFAQALIKYDVSRRTKWKFG